MEDFCADNATMSDFLAVVAKGDELRVLRNGAEVALVKPVVSPNGAQDEVDRSTGWIMRLRGKYNLDKHGFTQEEVDSWRDRSLPPEPIDFG